MAKPVQIGRQGPKDIMLTPEQRSTHMHVMGASGRGKSKALEHLIRQDIRAGHGVIVIDPHGTLYDELVKWCTWSDLHRFRRIHLIDPSRGQSTVGFNPLWVREGESVTRRVDRVVESFAEVWGGEDTSTRPRLKKVLTCVFYALAHRRLSLVEASDLLSTSDHEGLRTYLSDNLDHPLFERLWGDFNGLPAKQLHEYFESTDSRLMPFLASPVISAMLGSIERPIDFRKCMDNDEIVLINLAESDHLSFSDSRVIGTLITNELFSLASRRSEEIGKRHPCYFYLDECYRFLNADIEDMLNQTRKRGLHVTLVNHYLQQLRQAGEGIYHAVMTNAQTKLIFGGASDEDAEILARELFRAEFDLNQVEDPLSRPLPTGRFNRDTMQSWGGSSGSTTGSGTMSGGGAGSVLSLAQFHTDGGEAIGGFTETIGSSEGESWAESEFASYSDVESQGEHEVLVPEYAIMPTALKSLEKVVHDSIVQLRTLGNQFAILKVGDRRSLNIRIPFVKDTPAFDDSLNAFVTAVDGSSEYTLPTAEALKTVAARREALVRAARPEEPTDFKEPIEDWED